MSDAQIDAMRVAGAEGAGQTYHKSRNVSIIVDSTADWAKGVPERLGVEVLPFSYISEEGEFADDGWQRITAHDFYQDMRDNPEKRLTTAAITPGKYYECFERYAKIGTPTLYLCLTEGLSSSINNARQAKEMIAESYPDFELEVLDNKVDSAAGMLLAIEVVRLAERGMELQDLVAWAKDAANFIHGYFTLDSFDALAKGGRIPPAAANIGGKLDIKPELSFDVSGSLTLRKMCRGRKKALRAILDDFRQNYAHDTSLPLAIVSSDAEKDADWLEKEIRKEKGLEALTIIRSQVSPILGVHVGPGMVALCFWGTDRRESLSLTDRIAKRVRREG